MYKYFYSLLVASLLLSGSSCSGGNNVFNNPFLANVSVNLTIDLSLPQYNQLNFAGNSVYQPNAGNSGVILVNIGGQFLAWDAADPNVAPEPCTTLQIDGLEAVSTCADPNRYNLVTGQPTDTEGLEYTLLNYQVTEGNGVLQVTN
mgnify:CR=1 FL=1